MLWLGRELLASSIVGSKEFQSLASFVHDGTPQHLFYNCIHLFNDDLRLRVVYYTISKLGAYYFP